MRSAIPHRCCGRDQGCGEREAGSEARLEPKRDFWAALEAATNAIERVRLARGLIDDAGCELVDAFGDEGWTLSDIATVLEQIDEL